jgi:hypothetical protein
MHLHVSDAQVLIVDQAGIVAAWVKGLPFQLFKEFVWLEIRYSEVITVGHLHKVAFLFSVR